MFENRNGVPITVKLSRLLSLCLRTPFSLCSHKYYCFFLRRCSHFVCALLSFVCVRVCCSSHFISFHVIIVTCSWWSLSLSPCLKCACICACVCFCFCFQHVRTNVCAHRQVCMCLCMLPTLVWTISIVSAVFNWHFSVKLTTHQIIWIGCFRFIAFIRFLIAIFDVHTPCHGLDYWFRRTNIFTQTQFRLASKLIECLSIEIALLTELAYLFTCVAPSVRSFDEFYHLKSYSQ